MEDLQQLRREIDQIDRQITDLFRRRMAVTAEVGAYKVAHRLPVLDPQREQEVLAKKAQLVEEALRGDVTELFETIMSISRRQQRRLVEEDDPDFAHYIQARAAARTPLDNPRVLYQGEPGAWAEEAAVRFFGDNCPRDRAARWEDIFLALKEGRADYGVLPIENSSTGSINQVYDMLARYGAFIVGEQVVRVEHCLCAPPGASLDTLEETVAKLGDKPVYFTVDLDVLDPSVFPGTGTPEPGGVSFEALRKAVTLVCARCNVVGCDVNELSPPYDQSGVSNAVAAKVVREMLLALEK